MCACSVKRDFSEFDARKIRECLGSNATSSCGKKCQKGHMLKASPTQKSETCFRGPWTSHGVRKKKRRCWHRWRGSIAMVEEYWSYRYLGRFPKESTGSWYNTIDSQLIILFCCSFFPCMRTYIYIYFILLIESPQWVVYSYCRHLSQDHELCQKLRSTIRWSKKNQLSISLNYKIWVVR